MEAAVKLLQVVRIAMLVSVALYVLVGESLARRSTTEPGTNFYFVITLVAVTMAGMAFAVRRLLVIPAEARMAGQPEDTAALNRWRTGYIVIFALCEAIALLGLVLRITGFSLSQAAPLYLASFIMLAFFGPRTPSRAIG